MVKIDFHLQLINKNNDACTKYKIPEGRFCGRKDNIVKDLGNIIQATARGYRYRAVKFRKGKKPVVSYNVKSAIFKRIAAGHNDRDFNCQVGLEILLEMNGGLIYAYFVSLATVNRMCCGQYQFIKDKPVILTSEKMTWKEHIWYSPVLWLNSRVHYGPEFTTPDCGPDCELCS